MGVYQDMCNWRWSCLRGGGYLSISICCARQNAFTTNKLFQSDYLKVVGQDIESFCASLLYFTGICQYKFEIHNPRKLGPLNLTLYVLIDSGKVDIKRIEFRII